MPIISIKDNENNRWKRNKKQTNKQTKAIRVSFNNYFKEKVIIWVKAYCDGV